MSLIILGSQNFFYLCMALSILEHFIKLQQESNLFYISFSFPSIDISSFKKGKKNLSLG